MTLPPDIPEVSCGCKGFHFCNREDTEETFPAPEVVISNCRVVLLPRCIQDIDLHFLPIQHHLLPIAVCFSRLIILYKLEKMKSISIFNIIFPFQNLF